MAATNGTTDNVRQRLDAMRSGLAERREAAAQSLLDFKNTPASQTGMTARDKLNAVRDIVQRLKIADLTNVEVGAVVSQQPLPYGKDVSTQKEV